MSAVLLLVGVLIAVFGVGTTLRWWYAPLTRALNGIQPIWLGPAQLSLGVGLALGGGSLLVTAPGPHDTMIRWTVVIAVETLPFLAGGLIEREHRRYLAEEPGGRRSRPTLVRRALRYLLTHQQPAGGPTWPTR